MFAVASATYTFLQQQVCVLCACVLNRANLVVYNYASNSTYARLFTVPFLLQAEGLQARWRTVQSQVLDTTPEPDDDVSLYRLFGFSLFAGISFRKRVLCGPLRRKLSAAKYRLQLQVYQSLIEDDKSCLPACIKYQDRGKMTFPRKDMLPFCRDCSVAIKTYLNPSMYHSLGRTLMQVITCR